MTGRRCTKLTSVRYFLTLIAVAAWASVAEAQGAGVRGGVSIDPDQVYFGAHYETGALVDRLHFRPNAEVGFGDDLTLIALNFEFVYKFPQRSGWQLYAGAGPAVNFYFFDSPGDDDVSNRAGRQLPHRRRAAGRAVLRSSRSAPSTAPSLKFGVGWTFR